MITNFLDNSLFHLENLFWFKNLHNNFIEEFSKSSIFCWELQILLNNTLDTSTFYSLIKSPYFNWEFNSFLYLYFYNYSDIYYDFLINYNFGLIYDIWSNDVKVNYYYSLFWFIKKFIKINLFIFIIYNIFFLTYLENYIKQIISGNNLLKLFILNESEKEIGPVDDFFFFVILFVLTISSFIFMAIIVILFNSSIFIWTIGGLFLISFLILTVPLNLLLDFGISFFVYVRGSSTSTNLVKELLFDIISTTTIFIRFVIQNIRFLFIFLAIFELLEWIFANNSEIFTLNNYATNNIFINTNLNNYVFANNQFNLLIINTILFIILYFYYSLHLIFLLLVQITIYIGISSWLFFFLYSTKFLGKYEKYFFKKI